MFRRTLLATLMSALAGTGLVAAAGPAQAVNSYNGDVNLLAPAEAGVLRVRGWVYDDDNGSAPVQLQLFVGGIWSDPNAQYIDLGVTDVARPDVQAAFPGVAGPTTGFDRTVEVAKYGRQPIYLYALNAVGPDPGPAVLVNGAEVVIDDPNPTGTLASVTSPAPGQVAVSGRAFDRSHMDWRIGVEITANSTPIGSLVSNQVEPGSSADYGFSGTLAAPAGAVTVCATAKNVGVGSDRSLGCRQVQVAAVPVIPPVIPPVTPPPTAKDPISVSLKAVKKKSRLRVDVSPDMAGDDYDVMIQRKVGRKWRVVLRTSTRGHRDVVVVDLARGRYRVVVPDQHGMTGASAKARLRR